MKLAGIHHVTLRSPNPAASRRFYEEMLGLQFMEIPVGSAVTSIWKGTPSEGILLAAQVGSSILVIMPPLEGAPEGDRFSEYRTGVDHLAVAAENRAELDTLVERLRNAGVATQGVETDVVLGKEYVAFRDPDNVQVEAYMT